MRKNRYVSLSRGRSRRRRNGWKIAFVVLLIAAALVVAILLLNRTATQPFSTVTPASSPIQTAEPTPDHSDEDPTADPEEEVNLPTSAESESARETAKKNPVETLITSYAARYSQAESAGRSLLEKYSLKLMSFDMATALCHGQVMEIRSVFEGLEQGEAVGTWQSATARIEASEGSYAISARLENGNTLTGTVSSTMSRMTCTIADAEGAAIAVVEVVSANDGCYVQCWRPKGVYPNVRYLTSGLGLHCAIDDTRQSALYDDVPVNWAAAAAGSAKIIRFTEGGALVNQAGTETVYEK